MRQRASTDGWPTAQRTGISGSKTKWPVYTRRFAESSTGVDNWAIRRHLPKNAQTADVHGPEPRPAVELPILRHNVPAPARVRAQLSFRVRRRSGSPTIDLHYGVRQDPSVLVFPYRSCLNRSVISMSRHGLRSTLCIV